MISLCVLLMCGGIIEVVDNENLWGAVFQYCTGVGLICAANMCLMAVGTSLLSKMLGAEKQGMKFAGMSYCCIVCIVCSYSQLGSRHI